jgi:hypothetical protein
MRNPSSKIQSSYKFLLSRRKAIWTPTKISVSKNWTKRLLGVDTMQWRNM